MHDLKPHVLRLTRDSLLPLVSLVPGARILDGAFHQIQTAIAVPKDRPAALAYATAFMEQAKASGFVRAAFDNAGLKDLAVAPACAGR